jgi:hypothetical protein
LGSLKFKKKMMNITLRGSGMSLLVSEMLIEQAKRVGATNSERYRPGIEKEHFARVVVRQIYPLATSFYTREGAEVYDPTSKLVLGRATEGDWAVELSWQDAASSLAATMN